MTQRISRWTLSMLLIVTLGMTGLALAEHPRTGGENCQRGPDGSERCGPAPFIDKEKLIQELNLTPEQRQAMEGFRAKNMEIRQKQREIFAKRMELNQLLRQPKVDEDAVRERARTLGTEMSSLHAERIENLLTLRRTLEPEQFAKLMDSIADAFGGPDGPGGGKWMHRRGENTQ